MDGGLELWGTFSVADHLRQQPFVTDVLLYDCLMVPVPAKDGRAYWQGRGWEPERQKPLLDALESLAFQMPWTTAQTEQWGERFGNDRAAMAQAVGWDLQAIGHANPDTTAQYVTRQILADYANEKVDNKLFADLFALVKRPDSKIEAVTAYDSRADLTRGLKLKLATAGEADAPAQTPAAVFEWTIHAPHDPWSDDVTLLKQAVNLAKRPDFREHRAYFYRWLHNIEALPAEIVRPEFARRLADYEHIMRAQGYRTRAKRATQVLMLAPGLLALIEPISAAVLGTAIGIGGYVIDEYVPKPEPDERTRVAAMAYDIKHEFGMTIAGG